MGKIFRVHVNISPGARVQHHDHVHPRCTWIYPRGAGQLLQCTRVQDSLANCSTVLHHCYTSEAHDSVNSGLYRISRIYKTEIFGTFYKLHLLCIYRVLARTTKTSGRSILNQRENYREVIRTSLQYSTKIISLNIFDKFHEKASKTEIVS